MMSGTDVRPWEREVTPEEFQEGNRQVIAEFRANGGKVGGDYEWADLLLLTTTGARSGRAHTVPLAYMVEGGRIVVSSLVETAYPAWYHNLRANPAVTLEIGADSFGATATVAEGAERARLWAWVEREWPLLVEHQATTALPVPLVVLGRVASGE